MKSNKKILICALFIALICCISAVSAADSEDTVLADDNAVDEVSTEAEPVTLDSAPDETGGEELSVDENQPALSTNEKVIYVGQNGTGDGDGTPENPYKNLSLACQNANDEHHDNVIIYIYEGTYYLGDQLDFDTDNLLIQGLGNVIITNVYNMNPPSGPSKFIYPEAFGLTDISSKFTASNIIFDATNHTTGFYYMDYSSMMPDAIIISYFLPFFGQTSLATYNNCSFIGFNNGNYLMGHVVNTSPRSKYTFAYNSTFTNCSFDMRCNIFGQWVENTEFIFDYCDFYYNPNNIQYIGADMGVPWSTSISMENVWFGQNKLPGYISSSKHYNPNEPYIIPVNRYAIFSVSQNYLGDNQYEIIGKLTWNGTDNQDGMENFQPMTVNLESNTGNINSTAILTNGIFRTIYTSSTPVNEVIVRLDNEEIELNFVNVDITADSVSIYYGDDENITIAFSQEINANVTITVNNNTYTVPVTGNSVVFTIPEILKEGLYPVAILLNDNNYYGEASTNITVSKVSVYTFEMEPSSEVKVGENLNITITLPDDATGNVTVNVGNDTQVLPANATLVASFGNLNATTYPITVSYSGDDKYTQNELSDSVSVDKGESSVSIDPEIVADYGKIAIPVNTTNAKGVSVRVFSKSGLQILNTTFESDVIELDLAGGEYRLVVTTIVDDNYNPAEVEASLTVNKLESKMTIVMIDGLNVTGVLKDSDGNFIANAEIQCQVGEENVTAITNENGEFTVTVTSNVVLNMTFEGNSNITGCDAVITIKNLRTTPKATMIDVPSTMTKTAVDYKAGEKGTMFYFYLRDADGKGLANKAIKIGIFDKIYTVKTDSNGRGGLQINIANANYYTYGISFLGDDDYKASFAVCSLEIVKKSVTITPAKTSYTFKTSAKTKTITATLKSSNSYIPKGKQVTLTIAGKTFKATIGDKGQISLNVGSITAKGTYKVAIKFAGTNTYAAATSKTITVKIS